MSQVEQGVPVTYLSHVYKHQLTILYHRIFRLQVKVQQTVGIGNGIDNAQHQVDALLWEVAAYMADLLPLAFDGARNTASAGNLNGMQLMEQLGVFPCKLVDTLRLALDARTERVGLKQFIDQAILTAHPDHVK